MNCLCYSFDDIIRYYFERGYENKKIKEVLQNSHDIEISESTVKRALRRLGLRRRPEVTTALLSRAECVIDSELQGPGKNILCRSMQYRSFAVYMQCKTNIFV